MNRSAFIKAILVAEVVLILWGLTLLFANLEGAIVMAWNFGGPIAAGYLAARVAVDSSLLASFSAGLLFMVLVAAASVILNEGQGLMFVGGLIWVPVLTILGAMLGRFDVRSQ